MIGSVGAALESREWAIEDWITEEGVRRAAQLWVTMGASTETGDHEAMHHQWQSVVDQGIESAAGVEFSADIRSVLHTMTGFLRDARVYVIDAAVSQGIVEGTRTLPHGTPLAVSLLACPVGFVYLEGDHLRLPHPRYPAGDIVRALNWSEGPQNAKGVPTVVVGVWVDRGEGHLHWRQSVLAPEGSAWDGPIMETKFDDTGHASVNMVESLTTSPMPATPHAQAALHLVVSYLLIFGAFVSERIVTVDQEAPDRHARKRAARAGLELGTAHVIHMRELEHTRARRYGLGGPDWSCSWVVSAHVRNQLVARNLIGLVRHARNGFGDRERRRGTRRRLSAHPCRSSQHGRDRRQDQSLTPPPPPVAAQLGPAFAAPTVVALCRCHRSTTRTTGLDTRSGLVLSPFM